MEFAKVEDQFKKSPDLRQEDIDTLQDWISKQPNLPTITDLEVILFLHANYYKIEAAKTNIEKYFTCRTNVSHLFDKRNICSKEMQTAHDLFMMTVMPKPTKEGHRLILIKIMNNNPSLFVCADAFKLFVFTTDAFLMEHGISEGHVIAVDLSGVQLGHVTRLGIFAIKNILYYLQEASTFRLKGLHFFNIVPFVDKIVFLMKPFMKKELWEVFHLHSTMESFYKFIEPEILPSNYPGGAADTLEHYHKHTYDHLVELKDYFIEEEQTRRLIKTDKNGKSKNNNNNNITQNFKKLDID